MRVAVIGNGMVGQRFLEQLVRLGTGAEITVFSDEPRPAYDRVQLTSFLSGKSASDLNVVPERFFQRHGITLRLNDGVLAIDPVQKLVRSARYKDVPYDKLVIATGSYPFVPPVSGSDRRHCFVYRTIEDLEVIAAAAGRSKVGVVIGGGLLGLECAYGLRRRGMNVTVVHLMDRLMERQLDPSAAKLLQQHLERQGVRVVLSAQTEALVGSDRVAAVRLKDGRELAAELVVMAAGIVPNLDLARAAGLACERGVLVNDTLQTFDPRIYAVGECVQHRKALYGLVAPLYEQARVCANHLAGHGTTRYSGSVISTRLKVTGVELFSAGNLAGGEGTRDLTYRDGKRGVYKRLVLRGRRLEGAILYGDASDAGWYFDLIRAATDVTRYRDRLVFGQRHAEAAAA